MKASKIILPHFVFISQAIIYIFLNVFAMKRMLCRGKRYKIDKSVDVKNNNL